MGDTIWTEAKADEAAKVERKAAAAKYPTEACSRCKGNGYLPRQTVEHGVCFKCRGSGTQVAGKANRDALAKDLAAIEVTRLRRCWLAIRDELRAAEASNDGGWAAKHTIESRRRYLANYESAGKRAVRELEAM